MPDWARTCAISIAAGRCALGVSALVAPHALRVWVGDLADEPGAVVLGRALGARDVAIGVPTLVALVRDDADLAALLVAAGGLADLVDATASTLGWSGLPRRGRYAVLAASAGSAVVSALAARRLACRRH